MNDQTTIKNSYGYGESMMALTAKPKSKMEEKMEKLERMAAEAMMKDIKRHQPKKYKKINRKAKTMDQIEK